MVRSVPSPLEYLYVLSEEARACCVISANIIPKDMLKILVNVRSRSFYAPDFKLLGVQVARDKSGQEWKPVVGDLG